MTNPKNSAWYYDEPSKLVSLAYDMEIFKPSNKVLDLGCGFGRNSNWLAEKDLEVTAININQSELEVAKKKARKKNLEVNYLLADVKDLPFSGDSYDVVIDSGCTHQLNKPYQKVAFSEIDRVLKPQGILLYFGFTKEHLAYGEDEAVDKYRSVSDVAKQLGSSYKILKTGKVSWPTRQEESASFAFHIGVNIVFKKKLG